MRPSAVLIALLGAAAPLAAQNPPAANAPRPPAMVLTIPAWPDGTLIPAKHTQAGEQVSPELKWTNVPPGTQSFVVNMLDPDVAQQRSPETQPHWIVWDIPGSAMGLPEGVPSGPQLPGGARQISASGPQYRGPGAPASGPLHHYTFEVYALDVKLDDVQPSTSPDPLTAALETRRAVMTAMKGHVIGKAVYVGLFKRPPTP